jgi:hypothetical protein
VLGLLLAGVAEYQREQMVRMQGASFRQVFDRMRTWFQVNF